MAAATAYGEKVPGRTRSPQRVDGLQLSFEPADIVNEVMSFGSPTPIEVAVSGPKLADNRAYAEKIKRAAGARSPPCATCNSCSRWTTRPSK